MMRRPLNRGLIIRLVAVIVLGIVIIVTGESDAARYSYDSTVIPENSIPKLDRQTYVFLTEYGKQLQNLSNTYGIDWRLALAVLRQESAFDPGAVSHKGAEGFMQLMPSTGLQLASLHDVEDISNPYMNLKLGVIHLRNMVRDFPEAEGKNRIELAVAAYNCGLTRVQDAQTIAEYLGDKPEAWVAVKSALPLLSARYAPLHKHIWTSGKPTSGYFGEYDQTLTYVENVMQYYDIYRNVLHR
jgi:membrane-bound lytic murein transglycosylase MltF